MKRLYVLTGSSASTDAETLLASSGISFEVVKVTGRDTLAGIHRDLEIGTLPALLSETALLQGMKEIKTYVEGRRA